MSVNPNMSLQVKLPDEGFVTEITAEDLWTANTFHKFDVFLKL